MNTEHYAVISSTCLGKGGGARKRIIVGAVILGMMLSTAVVGGGSTPQPGGVEVAPETLLAPTVTAVPEETIVPEIMTYSMEQADCFEDVALEFEREYPNIQLEFITMPQDKYQEARPLLFESGQAPDIFRWSGGSGAIRGLLAKDWIRPFHPEGTVTQEWISCWPKQTGRGWPSAVRTRFSGPNRHAIPVNSSSHLMG